MPHSPIEFVQGQSTIFTKNWDGTSSTTMYPWDYFTSPQSRDWGGPNNTPGFHSRVKAKTLPMNDMYSKQFVRSGQSQSSGSRVQFFSGTQDWQETSSYLHYISPGQVSATDPPLNHKSDDGKAQARLADSVNAMKVNLGEVFAERKQTVALLVSTAERIAVAARALRRGRLGDVYDALSMDVKHSLSPRQHAAILRTPPERRVASSWLQFKYGWKPLVQDCHGAAELLGQHIAGRPSHVSFRGSAKTFTPSSSRVLGEGSFDFTGINTTTKHKYVCRFSLDSESRAGLAQTGLTNPALLAWELLPYSFVVDWFLPVGNYLQSLDDFSGFSFVDGCETYYTEATRLDVHSLEYHNRHIGGGVFESFTERTNTFSKGVQFNRTRLYSPPRASLGSFKNPLGSIPLDRFATAFSLLQVEFGRSHR